MITIRELANLLQEGLNNNTFKEEFVIGANVADFRKYMGKPLEQDRPTRGILRMLSGKFQPVKNLENFNTILILELLVEQKRLPVIEQILNNYIAINVGDTADIEGYQAVINFDIPTVGVAKNAIEGSGIPVQIVCYYNFIKNAYYGNQVQYYYIAEDGTQSQIIPIDRIFNKNMETAAYQALGSVTALNLNSENNSGLSLTFTLINEPFYVMLANAIATDTFQNTTYRIRSVLAGVFDVTEDYIITSAAMSATPGDLIVMHCEFARAYLIGGQNEQI